MEDSRSSDLLVVLQWVLVMLWSVLVVFQLGSSGLQRL